MPTVNNTLAQQTDTELVTAFQVKHDAHAYTELYNRYYSKVERYCIKALTDLPSAKDAAQDVFLKVFEKLTTLQKPDRWRAWLFSIARNVVLNTHKKNARKRVKAIDDFILVADENTELEALREKERKLIALPQLLEMPDTRILKMKYVEGRTIEQLSRDMQLNKSAVKMRLLRARHRVINRYERQYSHSA